MTKKVGFNSTLFDKIEIMQAVLDGARLQCRQYTHGGGEEWVDVDTAQVNFIRWHWDDTKYLYRIKPKEPREFHLYIAKNDPTNITACIKKDDRTVEVGLCYEFVKVREVIEEC